METYRFSILRVEPDELRGEIVNVGLVVFLADALDVRIAKTPHKMRALDPEFSSANLDQLVAFLIETDKSLVGDNSSAERRQQYLANMPGTAFSELGYFQCDPARYESKLKGLMDDLVYPPARRIARNSNATRLETQLREDFMQRGILGDTFEDINHHKVVPRYPISSEENLVADFALRNGVLHVCATLDLRGKVETVRIDKFKQGAVKAVMLDRAIKLNNGAKTIAVVALPDSMREYTQPHLNVLNDYAEHVYNFLVPEEAQALLQYFSNAAGHASA